MIRSCSAIAISLIALFSLRCSNLTGGSGEETTNGRVVGSLLKENGEPASGAIVSLVPDDFNAMVDASLPDSLSDITDATGHYSLHPAGTGIYNIQAADAAGNSKVLITNIQVSETGTTNVAQHSFLRPGFLKIIILGFLGREGNYVYLPGTLFSARMETDTAVFSGIPAGFIPSANFASVVDTAPPIVMKTGFSVATGDTTTISYCNGWKNSKHIVLNTSPGGVFITNPVYNFPVLIRLSWRNFNFNEADGMGRDLRFVKSNGMPLPFEIEHWEPRLGLAEVWVKVDTIHENDSTQSIMMMYGNQDAPDESNGAEVFDTANGFMGVWHLNEFNGPTAFDATLNRYDGVVSSSGPVTVPGNIYMAKQFDGRSHYITMPNTATSKLNFQENGYYSISAWVSIDEIKPSRQAIISKGNMQYSLAVVDSFCAFTEFKSMVGWKTARSTPSMTFINVPSRTWILFTGIRAGNRQYLYIDDGLCADTTNEFIASARPRVIGFDVSIGRIENSDATAPCYFGGIIDEVRIQNVALTEDWVRLCFENQIWNGCLVRFQ